MASLTSTPLQARRPAPRPASQNDPDTARRQAVAANLRQLTPAKPYTQARSSSPTSDSSSSPSAKSKSWPRSSNLASTARSMIQSPKRCRCIPSSAFNSNSSINNSASWRVVRLTLLLALSKWNQANPRLSTRSVKPRRPNSSWYCSCSSQAQPTERALQCDSGACPH